MTHHDAPAELLPYTPTQTLAVEEPSPYTDADFRMSELTIQRLREAVPYNTRIAYRWIWEGAGPDKPTPDPPGGFIGWCRDWDRVPLPATSETLAEYVSHMITAKRSPATISQHIGCIRRMHRLAKRSGQPDTAQAQELLRGYKRERAEDGAEEDEARPLLLDEMQRMIDTLDLDSTLGKRDQLVLVLGFALMARRSELAALRIADIGETRSGIVVRIRTSKTDKKSEGVKVAIPPADDPLIDPVGLARAWKELLAARGISTGQLIRAVDKHGNPGGPIRPALVGEIVRRLARKAALPDASEYSAHSLRAGGLTAALQAGVPVGIAARHGRWSPTSPVVMKYARAADRWRDNAMRDVLSRPVTASETAGDSPMGAEL